MDQLKRDLRRSTALIGALDQRARDKGTVLDSLLQHKTTRFDALAVAREITYLRSNAVEEANFMVDSIVTAQNRVLSEMARLKAMSWEGYEQLTDDEMDLETLAKELDFGDDALDLPLEVPVGIEAETQNASEAETDIEGETEQPNNSETKPANGAVEVPDEREETTLEPQELVPQPASIERLKTPETHSRRRSTRIRYPVEETPEPSKSPDQEFFTPPPGVEVVSPVATRLLRRSARLHMDVAQAEPTKNDQPIVELPLPPKEIEALSDFALEKEATPEDTDLADRELVLLEKLEKLGASTDVYTTFMETHGLSELDAVITLEKVKTLAELQEVIGIKKIETKAVEPIQPSGRTRHRSTRRGSQNEKTPKEKPKAPLTEIAKLKQAFFNKENEEVESYGRPSSKTRSATAKPSKEPSTDNATEKIANLATETISRRMRAGRHAFSQPAIPAPAPLSKRESESELEPASASDPKAMHTSKLTKKLRAAHTPSTAAAATESDSSVPAYSGVIQIPTTGEDQNLYCHCQRSSFGRMIACDNAVDCPFDWYHLACLGLKHVPSGTWFCPACVEKLGKAPKTKAHLNKKNEERAAAKAAAAAKEEEEKSRKEKLNRRKRKR